jgi:hypothetical protein
MDLQAEPNFLLFLMCHLIVSIWRANIHEASAIRSGAIIDAMKQGALDIQQTELICEHICHSDEGSDEFKLLFGLSLTLNVFHQRVENDCEYAEVVAVLHNSQVL